LLFNSFDFGQYWIFYFKNEIKIFINHRRVYMKNKFMFFVIVGLVILSIFIVNYGQSITTDCIGAVIGLAGGALAVFDTVKYSRRKIALVPLWIGILILIVTGFIQFKGVIILAAFGFAALGLYIYFRLTEK